MKKEIVGRVYGTKEDMLKAVGKPVTVNGIEFLSAGSAAKYIADREEKNRATISKEIRRYLQGKRPSWTMYEKYLIV